MSKRMIHKDFGPSLWVPGSRHPRCRGKAVVPSRAAYCWDYVTCKNCLRMQPTKDQVAEITDAGLVVAFAKRNRKGKR